MTKRATANMTSVEPNVYDRTGKRGNHFLVLLRDQSSEIRKRFAYDRDQVDEQAVDSRASALRNAMLFAEKCRALLAGWPD